MNIPPTKPDDRIPTKLEALVQLLVNALRHSLITARRAVEAQEDSKSKESPQACEGAGQSTDEITGVSNESAIWQ